MDVALASCRELPEPDPDAKPLSSALSAAGVDARVLGWDDPDADFSRARITLLRSTWNYPLHPARFLSWAESTAARSRLVNPLEVVRWNLHKGYLLELERAGVPTVPTELVRADAPRPLARLMSDRGWSRVVVKPAISAASYRTRRFDARARVEGQAHLSAILEGGDALVQPYLESVEGHGERALVWVDGAVTHAIRKSPRLAGDAERASSAAVPVGADEAALAERAIAALGAPPMYARVDVVPGPDGAPVVMELELIEPSLFFAQGPRALARFVAAVVRELGR